MSFEVGGITFYEPSDLTLITNPTSITGLLAYNAGNVYRTEKSMWSLATHDHAGSTLYPNIIYGNTAAFFVYGKSDNTGYLWLGGGPSTSAGRMQLYGASAGVSSGKVVIYSNNIIAISSVQGQLSIRGNNALWNYALVAPNSDDGKLLAKDYVLHASSIDNKIDVTQIPIAQAQTSINKIKGITYKDKEAPTILRTGFTAQDLEATGIPGAVEYDNTHTFVGINPITLLPSLVEEIKALRQEVNELKARLK